MPELMANGKPLPRPSSRLHRRNSAISEPNEGRLATVERLVPNFYAGVKSNRLHIDLLGIGETEVQDALLGRMRGHYLSFFNWEAPSSFSCR